MYRRVHVPSEPVMHEKFNSLEDGSRKVPVGGGMPMWSCPPFALRSTGCAKKVTTAPGNGWSKAFLTVAVAVAALVKRRGNEEGAALDLSSVNDMWGPPFSVIVNDWKRAGPTYR